MNFDIEATIWDSEKRIKREKLIADQVTQSIDIKKSYRALEFGCGTGLISFNLQDKLKDVTCIDISKGMIDVVNTKIRKYKVDNMVAYQHDISNDQPLASKYNLIYTSMALHHIADIEITLRNLYLLLEQGGYLCIVELNEDDGSFHKAEEGFKGHNGFNQKELQKIIEKIGLTQVESHTFYRDKKIIDEISVDYSLFVMHGTKI